MKVKVGQWFKSPYNGKFVQVERVNGVEVMYSGVFFCHKEQIIKVANTPQELIQDEDIVYVKGYLHPLKVKYITSFEDKEIVKILTPNSNGGFDLQWSDEK